MFLALGIFFLTSCNPGANQDPVFDDSSSHIHFGLKEMSYLSAGFFFEALYSMAKCGELILSIQKECRLYSNLFKQAATHFLAASLKESSAHSSYSSWCQNRKFLSHVPASTQEEKELLGFLENRWLAKSIGFSTFFTDWICPSFGLFIQINPENTPSYARSPQIDRPKIYIKTIETWKGFLPHPRDYPLLLTRPSNISRYLPNYIDMSSGEPIENHISKSKQVYILDMTDLFCLDESDPRKWLKRWDFIAASLSKACIKQNIPLSSLCCIQRLGKRNLGGIRILPLQEFSKKDIETQEKFLLMWLSTFGLSANRVELDRHSSCLTAHNISSNLEVSKRTRAELVSFFSSFSIEKKTDLEPTQLMLQGTLKIIKELLESVPENKWQQIMQSRTKEMIVQTSFEQIQNLLKLLENPGAFFQAASHIEQIHACLTPLLEIFSPFTEQDFSKIYKKSLTFIPDTLSSLTTCGIHSSGMSNLAAILKAVKESEGMPPYIIYGENSYYELIHAAKLMSQKACHAQETEEKDWQEANLLLVQFQPTWKGVSKEISEYQIEQIEEMILKSLKARAGKSFTVALDSTIDFINSPRTKALLEKFTKEIKKGEINFIGYRSGIKFDLFGMDHYCGAPLYVIHNENPVWNSFDSLVTDSIMQTDHLSLNWFCLAYKTSALELDLYRKRIFDVTRAFLEKIPKGLYNSKLSYRVIPVSSDAYPSFIDITVAGPFHKLKTALLGFYLTFQCLKENIPLFYRISFGLYHTNLTMLFGNDFSTIRLTLGLDEKQIEVLEHVFKKIEELSQ